RAATCVADSTWDGDPGDPADAVGGGPFPGADEPAVSASVAGCGEASCCADVADAATVRCSAGVGVGAGVVGGAGVDSAAPEPGSAPGASTAGSVPPAGACAPDVWTLDAGAAPPWTT